MQGDSRITHLPPLFHRHWKYLHLAETAVAQQQQQKEPEFPFISKETEPARSFHHTQPHQPILICYHPKNPSADRYNHFSYSLSFKVPILQIK